MEETKNSQEAKDEVDELGDSDIKVILLGDSAVGKSKLVERFLMDEYNSRQLSTFALTLFRKVVTKNGKKVTVDIWDTAGQERFTSMHPSYYYRAHACILVFDVTRKVTYKNLQQWYSELRQYCENIPCILVANKVDVDYDVTKKNFKFASQNDLPFFFVSAADGANVVQVFDTAINSAIAFKEDGGDFIETALSLMDG